MTAPRRPGRSPGERPKAVVLGGAGFVGSAIVASLLRDGWTVHVVDSLEPDTFADAGRLAPSSEHVTFDRRPIESLGETPGLLRDCDAIIDSAGWTRHSDAERDPARDLRLNLSSHFEVLASLGADGPLYLLLGSLHQFAGATGTVGDDAPFAPLDVQGIHKCALEQHARRVSARTGARVAVVRVGNCIGPGQPVGPGDVGLVGGFIHILSEGGSLDVFDGPRRRNLCFTPDIGDLVAGLARQDLQGFVPMNVPGLSVEIVELAGALAGTVGRGSVRVVPMPPEFAKRDVRSPLFTGDELARRFPGFVPTPLPEMISRTLPGLEADQPR